MRSFPVRSVHLRDSCSATRPAAEDIFCSGRCDSSPPAHSTDLLKICTRYNSPDSSPSIGSQVSRPTALRPRTLLPLRSLIELLQTSKQTTLVRSTRLRRLWPFSLLTSALWKQLNCRALVPPCMPTDRSCMASFLLVRWLPDRIVYLPPRMLHTKPYLISAPFLHFPLQERRSLFRDDEQAKILLFVLSFPRQGCSRASPLTTAFGILLFLEKSFATRNGQGRFLNPLPNFCVPVFYGDYRVCD